MKITPSLPSELMGKDKLSLTNPVDKGFSDLLVNSIKKTAEAQKSAEKMTMALANGADIPMQDVISAVGKAETTLQTMLNVRDKAVEAYQEVLRMPI